MKKVNSKIVAVAFLLLTLLAGGLAAKTQFPQEMVVLKKIQMEMEVKSIFILFIFHNNHF